MQEAEVDHAGKTGRAKRLNPRHAPTEGMSERDDPPARSGEAGKRSLGRLASSFLPAALLGACCFRLGIAVLSPLLFPRSEAAPRLAGFVFSLPLSLFLPHSRRARLCVCARVCLPRCVCVCVFFLSFFSLLLNRSTGTAATPAPSAFASPSGHDQPVRSLSRCGGWQLCLGSFLSLSLSFCLTTKTALGELRGGRLFCPPCFV